MLFVASKPIITVKTGDTEYKAGALTVSGYDAMFAHVVRELYQYAINQWGEYDSVKQSFAKTDRVSLVEQAWFNEVYHEIRAALVADVTGELTIQAALALAFDNPEALHECYQAAIKQNPKLDPDHKEETELDASGAVKPVDEVKKKGTSRQKN